MPNSTYNRYKVAICTLAALWMHMEFIVDEKKLLYLPKSSKMETKA